MQIEQYNGGASNHVYKTHIEQVIACFLAKTNRLATLPLEKRKTVKECTQQFERRTNKRRRIILLIGYSMISSCSRTVRENCVNNNFCLKQRNKKNSMANDSKAWKKCVNRERECFENQLQFTVFFLFFFDY